MRPLIALGLVAAIAGCPSGTSRPCKKNTLFLTIQYAGAATAATEVDILVIVPGSATLPSPTPLTRKSTASHDTVEIDFSSYQPGQIVTVQATALAASQASPLAESSLPVPLANGCTAATITLGAANADAGGDLAISGPALQAMPAQHDFGAVLLGSTATSTTITITNIGNSDATVRAAASLPSAIFPINDSCTGQTLSPSASCVVGVAFAPQVSGAVTGTLTVSSDPGVAPATVVLRGTGVTNPTMTYTVTYDGNGSTGGTVPADGNLYTQGQTATVLGNSGNLVKSGNSFTGWNTQADGSGTRYSPASTFTVSANVTLYAQWSAGATYTVTYDGNGSTGGAVPADNTNYTQGQSVTVLSNTGGLVRAGYSFTGWNTQAGGGGTGYTQGSTFNMGTTNVTLYAQWTQLPTYTVTYDGNGSTGGTVPVDTTSYLQGATVTVIGNTGNLVKSGYSFNGWNTAANGSGISYGAALTFGMGAANVRLYAQWMALPTYTVTYNANGAFSGAVPTDGNQYLQGATVTVLGNTGALVKTNYSFSGWNTAANGTGATYTQGQTFPMGAANVTLYALWAATDTVTYNGNGNTGGAVPTDNNHYLQGATVTVLGNSGGLTRTGYNFNNWNTAANGSGTSYSAGNTFSMGAANVTLYAQWTAVSLTVTYNGNGNTGGSPPVDGNSYIIGQSVTVLGGGTLVRSGYSFNDWSTASGGGTSYAPNAMFTIGGSNVTLYAQWTCVPSCPSCVDTTGASNGCGGSCPFTCTSPEGACCAGGSCYTTSCGTCGNFCTGGDYCAEPGGGNCTNYLCIGGASSFPAGTCCGPTEDNCGGCVDIMSNTQHCGYCNVTCQAGHACMNGACQ